ncbi:ABC transporter substrate-binding protein [Butyrivibrio sp. MC2013]|uniref:ABC transporter substrate-binding protein n=1 Tax=Butyrivibrio sp. MC2013 TaxID=1280686 RepID=UPI00040555BC|nr:extracellular solute-binding protein [Butyrivibrio sp. MC2013]
MKKLAKLGTAMLSVVTVAAMLAGCSKEAPAADDNAAANTQDAAEVAAADKFVLFQSKTEIMGELNKLAEAYKEEKGVEIEVWETTGDSYFTDLKTNLSNGTGPALFSLAPGSESREMADYLEDIGSLEVAGKISDKLLDTVDGKVVGIPYTVEGFGVVYNADLYDPSKVTDTDAFISFLQDQKAAGVNGFGLSQEDYFLIAHILNTPFAVQADPDQYLADVLAGNARFADNDAFKDFARVMEAIRDNCTNPMDIAYDGNCGDFATGKSAAVHQGNWCYSMFADYDVAFDMAIAPLPIQGNDKVSVSVPTSWYVNVDADPAQKKAAMDFLDWLYGSETGVDYLMNKFGFIPVVDGMKSEQLDPLSQSVADTVAAGKTMPWVMSNWPAGLITNELAPITAQFFTSDMTGDELLDQLNDAFVNAAK